jgi:hypothetical protein
MERDGMTPPVPFRPKVACHGQCLDQLDDLEWPEYGTVIRDDLQHHALFPAADVSLHQRGHSCGTEKPHLPEIDHHRT